MFDQRIGQRIAFERSREIERRSRYIARQSGDAVAARSDGPNQMRRAVGRAVIRVGSAIAADGPLQPASR